MSVEARESMSDVWTRWQGHVVNGVFPLGRYLGCSDHSGVFLTKSAARRHAEVAVKLVPASRALAELQLPRWKRAGGLAQSHLLPLLEWGGCQLDGSPYLYVIMEYADQTLAQLLLHRALTDDETREMLLPILDALTFLHRQNLVQGQLKPANVLVVGDQLKLASDMIRRVSEGTLSANAPTVYDPPEALDGSSSTAGDIWALGVSLFEVLTRRPPSNFGEHRNTVVLPADFSPAFRDVVARCLSPRPQDRPSVTDLVAWAGGRSARSMPAATIQPATLERPEPRTPEAAPPRTVPSLATPEAARPVPSMAQSLKPRALVAVMLAAVVILALGWTGVRVFRTHRTPAAPAVSASGELLSQIPGAAAPAAAEVRAPVSAVFTTNPGGSDVPTPPSALHEVIPDVPRSARRSLRGHIKVSVRVIVDPDGSVFAAVADRTGPSRYFQRLAVEAAKKWTFPPVDTASRRPMQVQFDFSRNGTTGRAVTLR
jgi:TonB family protein